MQTAHAHAEFLMGGGRYMQKKTWNLEYSLHRHSPWRWQTRAVRLEPPECLPYRHRPASRRSESRAPSPHSRTCRSERDPQTQLQRSEVIALETHLPSRLRWANDSRQQGAVSHTSFETGQPLQCRLAATMRRGSRPWQRQDGPGAPTSSWPRKACASSTAFSSGTDSSNPSSPVYLQRQSGSRPIAACKRQNHATKTCPAAAHALGPGTGTLHATQAHLLGTQQMVN